MGCPPVRRDNPRALVYISVDLAHQVIFHAKVGKGGIYKDKLLCDCTYLKTEISIFALKIQMYQKLEVKYITIYTTSVSQSRITNRLM